MTLVVHLYVQDWRTDAEKRQSISQSGSVQQSQPKNKILVLIPNSYNQHLWT